MKGENLGLKLYFTPSSSSKNMLNVFNQFCVSVPSQSSLTLMSFHCQLLVQPSESVSQPRCFRLISNMWWVQIKLSS